MGPGLESVLCQLGLTGLAPQKSGVEKVNARVANTKELQLLFPGERATA